MSGRKVVEAPDVEHDAHNIKEDGNPTKERTVMMHKRQQDLLAREKRANDGESNRSRSTSRRERRKRIQKGMQDGKYMKTNSLEALEEADANGELNAMGPFERIGPDSTSMDGPVTMARAMRGEIPVRGTNGAQPYYMTPEKASGGVRTSTRGNVFNCLR